MAGLATAEPLVRDLQLLDREVAAGGVEARAAPAGRPALPEVPPELLLPGVVEQDDGAVAPRDLAPGHLFPPLPQLGVVGDPPAERDVGIADQPGQLPRRQLLVVPLAVLDRGRAGAEPGALPEAGPGDAVDLDQEVVRAVGVGAVSCGHGASSRR